MNQYCNIIGVFFESLCRSICGQNQSKFTHIPPALLYLGHLAERLPRQSNTVFDKNLYVRSEGSTFDSNDTWLKGCSFKEKKTSYFR